MEIKKAERERITSSNTEARAVRANCVAHFRSTVIQYRRRRRAPHTAKKQKEGSDRLVVRGLAEGGLILAAHYVIGTEELISARNQGDKAGSEYVFTNEDELVLSGKIAAKNLKMTKVSMIAEQIGQCPVLSFGISAGDISMTNTETKSRIREQAFQSAFLSGFSFQMI